MKNNNNNNWLNPIKNYEDMVNVVNVANCLLDLNAEYYKFTL